MSSKFTEMIILIVLLMAAFMMIFTLVLVVALMTILMIRPSTWLTVALPRCSESKRGDEKTADVVHALPDPRARKGVPL